MCVSDGLQLADLQFERLQLRQLHFETRDRCLELGFAKEQTSCTHHTPTKRTTEGTQAESSVKHTHAHHNSESGGRQAEVTLPLSVFHPSSFISPSFTFS